MDKKNYWWTDRAWRIVQTNLREIDMAGYRVAYDYTNGWQGICQCDNCRKRFYDMYGEDLPVTEDPFNPVYKKYVTFQNKTEEEVYYTNITDFPAFTINNFDKGKGVFIPWKHGHEYYNFGFPAMSNFMADVLENILGLRAVGGNLPPMVEVSCTQKIDGSACYIHLVNDSGFFCGSYFNPIELHNLTAEITRNREKYPLHIRI